MKVMIFTNDSSMVEMIQKSDSITDEHSVIFADTNDPLDLMSTVCSQNPSLLILDDDFIKPNSAHLIKSIKKVNSGIDIIFITSNSSLALGKEVSQLAIQFYAIKPVENKDIKDLLGSILESKRKRNPIN